MLVPGLLTFLGSSLLWGWVTSASFKRVCYFTNWSGDLLIPEAHFYLEDLDPRLCSHLMYAFAKINTDTFELLPTRPDDEGEDGEKGRYVLFNDLKKTYTDLVTMLSVGGSLQANTGFAKVVETVENMRAFARHCVEFLRQWGFDGLDVDWEYPGDPEETRANFTMLLLELRTIFEKEAESTGNKKLVLSMAAPVSEDLMTRGYEIDKVSSIVDFINLMAYDFHGAWNHISGFNAPLNSREGDWRFMPDLNVKWGIDTWIQRGAPPDKLVVGIAGYGASYTLSDNSSTDVGSEVSGPGRPGPYRVMEGQMAYYEICELIEKGGGQYVWDDLQKVPYVYTNDTWIGYDDERSVAVKTEWMIQKELGGVMMWSLDLDDFKGTFCNKGRFPLLRSVVKTVAKYYEDVTVPPTTLRTTTTTVATTTTTSTTTTKPPTTTSVTKTTSTTRTTTKTTQPTRTSTTTTATTTATTKATTTKATTTPTPTTTTTTTKATTGGNCVLTSTRRPVSSTNNWVDNLPDWIGKKNGDDDDDDYNADDDDDVDIDDTGKGNGIDTFGNAIENGVETNAASRDRSGAKNVGMTAGSRQLGDKQIYLVTFYCAVIVTFTL